MANIGHTYDASCLLHNDTNLFTRRASHISVGPPSIKAHFFYCSSLPIDDPLLPVPPPSKPSSKAVRLPPRPFSIHDNRALEEAWLKIHKPFRSSDASQKPPDDHVRGNGQSRESESKVYDSVTRIFKGAHGRRGNKEPNIQAAFPSRAVSSSSRGAPVIQDQFTGVGSSTTEPKTGSPSAQEGDSKELTDSPILSPQTIHTAPLSSVSPILPEEIRQAEERAGLSPSRRRSRSRSPFKHRAKDDDGDRGIADTSDNQTQVQDLGSSPTDRSTSGTPFLRIGSRHGRGRSLSKLPSIEVESVNDTAHTVDGGAESSPAPSRATLQRRPKAAHLRRDSQTLETKKVQEAKVPVGVSRLHVVELPDLKMGPIYWDPVHDVSSVVRGTWFYKETMFPVESELANQLEEGYEYIKPWTPSYQDELNSCIEFGPEAELKVAHQIWPEEADETLMPTTTTDKHGYLAVPGDIESPEDDPMQTNAIKAAGKPENRAAGVLEEFNESFRLFAKSSIIFAGAYEGQILTPNQLPSFTRSRRPLGKIRKGQPVGVTVVRGFDYRAWERKYALKKGPSLKQTREGLVGMRAGNPTSSTLKTTCAACLSAQETSPVTDLVLVVHGIGQKLSERVESFHFTHAINAFRRSVNIELQSDAVKPWLRPDFGSLMVLPVNWRSKTELEDGEAGPEASQTDDDSTQNQYTLKDITAESLPAVRSLISDVMLDIPYYLSHHKPKMIAAVVKEANRIYRLWCQNNLGFQETGRVHIVAHSLGSVMAVDILSRQPTTLPKEIDVTSAKPRTDIFEFDTKSLFFCGSPAGFFLLLNRATLQPRRGREKPDTELEDTINRGVAGEPGVYGCLSVDNLYNVLHQNDPVAYRINACVDANYSNSLQQAFVPSASASWSQYFGSIFRGRPVTPAQSLATAPVRPNIAKLPSTVEMETHNFTQEEIAEKRMYLLNDNGQIDYTLKSGGGPLEIQYFNMLSAHSSYWILQDFVRFLVLEVGRKPGKSEAINSFKARKKGWGKK